MHQLGELNPQARRETARFDLLREDQPRPIATAGRRPECESRNP